MSKSDTENTNQNNPSTNTKQQGAFVVCQLHRTSRPLWRSKGLIPIPYHTIKQTKEESMADMNQMQTDGDEAKGHHGDEYEEIREQVSSLAENE